MPIFIGKTTHVPYCFLDKYIFVGKKLKLKKILNTLFAKKPKWKFIASRELK